MATPSLLLIPDRYKSGVLYSQLPESGAGDIDFTRASAATRVNASGLIELVASGVPRLDYTGGGCPSLLLEPQRTNLLTYSEEFDNAAWIKTDVTITANDAVSPDGFTNAELLTADGANSIHDIFQLFAGGTANSVSIFVKKGTARYINVATNYASTGSDWVSVVFDLDTLTSNIDQSGDLASSSVKIEDYGNGWYRLVSNTNAAASTSLYAFYGIVDTANPTRGNRGRVTLTSSATIIAWGAQAEVGSYATSYIKTTSAAVTRAADVASKTGISSLIGQTEGVIFVDFVLKNNISSVNRVISITETDWVTGGSIRLDVTSSAFTADFTDANANSGTITYSTTPAQNTRYKVAIAYKQNDCKLFINGVDRGSATSTGTMPSCSEIYLNELGGGFGGPYEAAEFNQAALYPVRLSNAELQSLTSL
jgi:hypothetical protein